MADPNGAAARSTGPFSLRLPAVILGVGLLLVLTWALTWTPGSYGLLFLGGTPVLYVIGLPLTGIGSGAVLKAWLDRRSRGSRRTHRSVPWR